MSIPAGRSGSRLSSTVSVLALVVALLALGTAGLAYQRGGGAEAIGATPAGSIWTSRR